MSDTPTLRDLIRPRDLIATRGYVYQVASDLDLDTTTAERIADYIVGEHERIGGSDARLVMVVDGDDATGPVCSWCWAIGGFCPHIAGGVSEHVQTGSDGLMDR